MSRITSLKYMYLQIHIVQTKRSAIMKIDIIICVIINVVSFKTYVWVLMASPRIRRISPTLTRRCVLVSRVCRFKSHPRQKLNFCRTHALRVYSAHSVKLAPTFGGREFSTWSWVLKYWSVFFADWLLTVIASVHGWKPISDVLDTNSTHTRTHTCIAYTSSPHLHGLCMLCWVHRKMPKKKSSVIASQSSKCILISTNIFF